MADNSQNIGDTYHQMAGNPSPNADSGNAFLNAYRANSTAGVAQVAPVNIQRADLQPSQGKGSSGGGMGGMGGGGGGTSGGGGGTGGGLPATMSA